ARRGAARARARRVARAPAGACPRALAQRVAPPRAARARRAGAALPAPGGAVAVTVRLVTRLGIAAGAVAALVLGAPAPHSDGAARAARTPAPDAEATGPDTRL